MGAVEIFRDISQELASLAMVKALEAAAFIDPLTGIGNRRFAEVKLAEVVAQTKRLGWPAGLVYVDLDHFKKINDVHGHAAGDALLKMVAETLSHNLRCFDFIVDGVARNSWWCLAVRRAIVWEWWRTGCDRWWKVPRFVEAAADRSDDLSGRDGNPGDRHSGTGAGARGPAALLGEAKQELRSERRGGGLIFGMGDPEGFEPSWSALEEHSLIR